MYIFDSRIRYSETDSEGKLSLEALLDYFQDCSTFQSEDLGLGIEYLKQMHLVWVLTSWQIVVDRYPKLGERVNVGTFPYDFKTCFGYRNFFMKDQSGQFLARANSLWTLLDTRTMHPVRPPEMMWKKYPLEERLDMDYASRKIVMPEHMIPMEPIEVRRQHLDTNHHVNNGQYVRIAAEYLPEGFDVIQLRAEYKKQAVLRDRLYPLVACESGKCMVALRDEQGNTYANVEFIG